MNFGGIYYTHVFEGNAYDPDRERVRELRMKGMEVPEIASETGIPAERAEAYCRKLGLPLTGSCLVHLTAVEESVPVICPVCGGELRRTLRGRQRKYCSTACKNRAAYERRLRENRGKPCVCENCGKTFCQVGGSYSQPRRFCSRECYFENRYGYYERRHGDNETSYGNELREDLE